MSLPYGLGWTPDLPDHRDLHDASPEILSILKPPTLAATLPPRVVLDGYFSPVEDQGKLGSCTANAAAGLLEYFERRTLGRHVDASRLFIYKASRKLLGWTGDQGAYLRTAMKSLALLGAPPEDQWPYDVARFDDEPPAFVYSLAQRWRGTLYYRLDPPGTGGALTLQNLKTRLSMEQPAMFGFPVYSSIRTDGLIPFPSSSDKLEGGHAVVASGYDDTKVVGADVGAVRVRNSWGIGWGEKGYGWLPYRYFTQRLAIDVWSLVRAEYVDLAPFV